MSGPEPAISLTTDRVIFADSSTEPLDLGRGYVLVTVHREPVGDEWGFITGYQPHAVLSKDDKEFAELTKKHLVIDPDVFGDKRTAKILNELKIRYYGWPVTVALRKGSMGRDKTLQFKCRDEYREVTHHSTPIKY